jgi:hypothetical protein
MKIKTFTLLAAGSLFAAQANAEVRINGFANIVAGHTSSDTELFGYTDKIDFSNESLFAIQVSGEINDKMSATGQIIARGSEDYNAKFEWAYLTYQASDKIDISAGRLRLPLFLYSESLDVGYSYHWISAPQTVYNVAFNNLDGVRVSYSTYASGLDIVAQAAYGVIDNELASLRADDTYLISFQAGNDTIKGRFVYGSGKATLNNPEINAALAPAFQVDPVLGDLLQANQDKSEFTGVSLSFDNFTWFASAEYTTTVTDDSLFADITSFYVTVGGRFGKLTPSFTYEESSSDDKIKFLDRVSQYPAPIQAAITPLVVGLQASQFRDYNISTLGLRYDFDAQIALKGEIMAVDNSFEGTDDTVVKFAVNYIF